MRNGWSLFESKAFGAVSIALIGVFATAVGASTAPRTSQAAVPRLAAPPPVAPALRPLSTSTDQRIVDDQNRQVLLRGANVNSLGEYWQGVPSIPATLPITQADWESMAAHGFSVIRLIVSWSMIEPSRGTFDDDYLDEVAAYVDAAAQHGIYSVIDMHQDAYTATISTTDPSVCPPGSTPARGWDGAPGWATITDGASTCLEGSDRNSSPAVVNAWNHFWDDTDGIRTEFAATWGKVATRFAGNPAVAGYDLLNEPEVSQPAAELTPKYEAMIGDSVRAIRAAESAVGAEFDHIIFVEPAIPAGNPSNGLVVPDPTRIGLGTANVVAAPHNYAESITNGTLDLSIEAMSDLFDSIASGLGLPVWIGEYGFWDTSPATLAKARRYAANEDAKAQGGAWWQWRQSCGDPHSVQWSGDAVISPDHVATHLNLVECPASLDIGANEAFLDILGRAFPRATPGRIVELASDPTTGVFSLTATAGSRDVGNQLIVWTRTKDDATHRVASAGLMDVHQMAVSGGRLITATVAAAGDYALAIGRPVPPGVSPGSTTPSTLAQVTTPTGPVSATPARPIRSTPAYTG